MSSDLPELTGSSQAATIAALVYYGGIALTEEKQFEYMQKQRVLLGAF